MRGTFEENRPFIENEYECAQWFEDSGLPPIHLRDALRSFVDENIHLPTPILRAKAFQFFVEHAQIELNPHTIFPDKINTGVDYKKSATRDIFSDELYVRFHDQVLSENIPEDFARRNQAFDLGVCMADADFWHTLPDWENVVKLGIPGIIKRAEEKKGALLKAGTLSTEQEIFYDSVIISYRAILTYIKRLYDASCAYEMKEYTQCLESLLAGVPHTLYEVMELCVIFLNMEEIGVERARSFGRIDQIYYPYYENDLKNGTYSLEEIREMLRYFFIKCQAAKRFADQPFAIAGVDENGQDATNDLTWLLVDVYDGMKIHNPKIHVCCHKGMPDALLNKLLSMIRSGSSSICLINNETVIAGYEKIGIRREEAQTYVPFGCYEPILVGKEEPMIGASWLNMPKAIEFAMNGGRDILTGERFSCETPICFDKYEDFESAFYQHLKYIIEFTKDNIQKQLKYNMLINPSPIYSGTIDSCIERGKDIFDGGVQYHNISIKCCGIATVVDCLLAVKKFVFDEKKLTFSQMRSMVLSNFEGNEMIRRKILASRIKYGNHIDEADTLAHNVYKFAASLIVNVPNIAGGRFRMGTDTITHNILFGKAMGATPDGRLARTPTSKNFNAMNGMDRNGISAYTLSVLTLDMTDFVDGAVMDFVMHPSMVEGEGGLNAMRRLVDVYFENGGFAIQGNIMNLEMLLEAKREPEKYKTLQVRVCGWNEFFVEMDEVVQNEFIKQLQVGSC